jgi:hypothetical protein
MMRLSNCNTARMESLNSGPIQMTWDPQTRLAVIRFGRDTNATGRDAQVLVTLTGGMGCGGEQALRPAR